MTTPSLPRFDIREILFSARGSWLNMSQVVGLRRRADDIHLVSHTTGMHAVRRSTDGRFANCASGWRGL